MSDWWKNPVLQGEDNDYGEYDYLINPLPKNEAHWDFSKDKWKCESCGKWSHLMFRTVEYFYCWDGYDSMSYDECWRCRIKSDIRCKVYSIKKKVKNFFKTLKLTYELCKADGHSWKEIKSNYKFAKALVR